MTNKSIILKENSYFKSFDSHRLYYKSIRPPHSRAVLIFVHGLNEHSERYKFPISYFSKKGYSLYLFDHRGHGKSDGLRSYVPSFDHYLKDVHEFVGLVSGKEKKKKIFLIGHSMGGQIVINYVAKHKANIQGFVASSANIQTAVKVPWIKKKLGIQVSKIFPKQLVSNEIDPKWISRDRQVVKDYKNDPLVPDKISLKLAAEMFENQDIILDLATEIRMPALIQHGDNDRICDKEGSKHFYRKLKSTDKTLKIYDKFYHELFNDIGKEEVFNDMNEWFLRHI